MELKKEKIIKIFKEIAFFSNETHEKIVKNDNFKFCDDWIMCKVDGVLYWIEIIPSIFSFNKLLDAKIQLTFKIRKENRHGDVLYTFTRLYD